MREKEKRRPLVARWTLTAELTLLTAAQIGSHESDYSDQTFATDAEGRLVLQGSTIAGALRSALNDRMAGYREQEIAAAYKLFGCLKPPKDINVQERESTVIVFDATAQSKAHASLRDHVRIAPGTGLAAEGKKYDHEVSLPGDIFAIRVDLLVPDRNEEECLLTALVTALEALEQGEIRFGARKSRGLGRCAVSKFRARRYDLMRAEGWEAYALSDYLDPLNDVPEANSFATSVRNALATASSEATAENSSDALLTLYAPLEEDARRQLCLCCACQVKGTLLIRTPGDVADVVHLTEQGKQLLSGTSLAGAVRSYALRVLNTLGIPQSTVDLETLFGPSPETLENPVSGKKPEASRVYVSEGEIVGNSVFRQTRVKIDRLTGGTIDGALFQEEPSACGEVQFEIAARRPSDAEVGLLLLVARDLAAGLLPIGGGAAVGRGLLEGRIEVTFPDAEKRTATFSGKACLPEDFALLQPYVEALLKGQDEQKKEATHGH
jgi:CRISPR/Cas system CSM-associated protein Csm3 (group 7 of RAMP superfamily)